MHEINLCESCACEAAEARNLVLGDSRESHQFVCDNCGELITYEYVFVQMPEIEKMKMEAL